MSHGAAGFAYALAALGTVAGRGDFADAAVECLEFERSNFDPQWGDWRDFRVPEPHWRSQWCHGAVGIGLARLGMSKLGSSWGDAVRADIDRALTGASRGWPGHADTLCCGALGSVELAREAGKVLGRGDLQRAFVPAAVGDLAQQVVGRELPLGCDGVVAVQCRAVSWPGRRRLYVPARSRRLAAESAHLGVTPFVGLKSRRPASMLRD